MIPLRRAFAWAWIASLCACGQPDADPDPAEAGYVDSWESRTVCARAVPLYNLGESCGADDFASYRLRKLTDVGARPVFSPDGRRLGFVDRHFGDVYELDLATGERVCVTCDFEHQGFWRVHYLPDGDYLLMGPRHYWGRLASRLFSNGLYFMPSDRSRRPVWMGIRIFEGIAVSRVERRIAYARSIFGTLLPWPNRLFVAEVDAEGRIRKEREVHRSIQFVEPQDFLPGDGVLVFSRYTPDTEVITLDLDTGKAENQSRAPGTGEEPEGLFPDGRFTLMESSRHLEKGDVGDVDIYALRLGSGGREVRRLTHFDDVPGEKASNPVVSPEGCRIAFMKGVEPESWQAMTGDSAGLYLLEALRCR